MDFTVTILGSGSAVPTSRRNPTAQYLTCCNRHILIDCAEGTQLQLRNLGIKFLRIEHILISHLHGDHYFGLVGLLSTMHLLGRTKPVYIYAPEGLKDIVELQLHYGGSRLAFEIIITTLDTKNPGLVFEDDKIKIEHFPLSHRIPTNGYLIMEKEKERTLNAALAEKDNVKIEHYHRLKRGEDVIDENGKLIAFEKYTTKGEGPKSYAYCSDTKYHEPVIPHIQNVDLLYHEATFVEQLADRAKQTFHSTALQAATIAKKADVKRLILGHLSARYDSGEIHTEEAKTVFENTEVVEDGVTYLV